MKKFFVLLVAFVSLSASAAELPDRTTFSVALERGDITQAQRWLEAGLPAGFEGSVIGSGLMVGAWEGNIPLMELFLAHGADVNQANVLGETALLHAAWKGHLAAVRWLLAHGALVDREGKQWMALHYAAFAGHGEIVRELLARGAEVDALSPNGSTPLMMTAREGRTEVATQLLTAGARRDIVNDNGENAVHWAMRNNNLQLAREIAGSEDFAALAARPSDSWGRAQRSQPVSDRADLLLVQAHRMEAAGQRQAALKLYRAALETLRKDAAAHREKVAPARAVTGLTISARRGTPEQQTAGFRYATPATGASSGQAPTGHEAIAAPPVEADAVDALLARAREMQAAGRRGEALDAYRQAAALLRRR